MVVTKSAVATDSGAELEELVGGDATETFESDPKFIDSEAGVGSSENVAVQRDTDDVEDSDEEEDEEDDLDDVEDDDELEDDDEFADEDDDEEVEDEEEEGIAAAGLTSVRGNMGSGTAVADVEEDEEDGDVEQGLDDDDILADDLYTDRGVESALRMMAVMAVTAEFAEYASL